MPISSTDLWTAAGVLLGFQVTSFLWRIAQEADVADRGDVSWLPPADIVNLAGMLTLALGVFILPTLAMPATWLGTRAFGLAVLLFVGHCFALAGHYELYNPKTRRSYEYFPRQEKAVIIVVAIAALLFVVLSAAS